MITHEDVITHIDSAFPRQKRAIGLNQAQTAAVIGVTSTTLERWRKLGVGPEYIETQTIKKSRIIYTKPAIADYLVSRQVRTA